MRLSQTQEEGTRPAGGARFIPAPRVAEVCAELKARRYVVARVAPLKAAERRRERSPERGSAPPPCAATALRAAIEEAVESALALRGALPPGVSVHADLAICIRDQMLRVRALGATGLVIALPRLWATGEPPLLDAEDSAVLSAWIRAAQNEPLVLLLDDQDRTVAALAPVPIELLVQAASGSRVAAIKPEIAQPVGGANRAANNPDPKPESAGARPVSIPLASIVLTESACGEEVAERADDAPETRPAAPQAYRTPPTVPAPVALEPASPPEPVAGDPSTAERLLTAAEWRSYAMDLDSARGPKPASVIDRLFATRYMPLLGAIARGQADAMVKGVADTFRSNFVHSYIESFPALRVTGKRPPMVLDVPDLAARLGRLNGARAVRLLLIDSLRYDLGERLCARLQHRLSGRAVCVERTLLWAALPTTTPAQIALLARGPDGLRDPPIESDPEPDVVRGRAVSTIRRERIGAREIMKLDLVEARLRGAGPAFDERFDRIAEELSDLVTRFLETLSARTLVYVFGDHGFCIPSEVRSTGPATQGGASPEEVLVPGYAWLVGGMH